MTIDDITRGQVIVSVVPPKGGPVLGPVSMQVDDVREFQLGEHVYSLELTELNNVAIGEDSASFLIADSAAEMSEREKIERLISAVEAMDDAVFIRNGHEHSAKEAADHLRGKLKTVADQIHSASEFIDHVASRSSVTGEDYSIRLAGGRIVATRDYLYEELSRLQRGR